MDQNNTFSGLDPKLQETYNRIMNVTPPPAGTTTAPPKTTVQPPVTSDPNPSTSVAPPVSPTPDTSTQSSNPANTYSAQPAYSSGTFAMAQPTTAAPIAAAQNLDLPVDKTQNSSVLKIVYIVGALVFFMVYTIFWIKIFKLPVPLPF